MVILKTRSRILSIACCLVVGGLVVSACSANTSEDALGGSRSEGADATDAIVGGAQHKISVQNDSEGVIENVKFTANPVVLGSTRRGNTPHCSYPVGSGSSTTLTPTGKIAPGDTVVAGILENKNTAGGGCMSQQSYVGVTAVYGGKSYYGLLQTSGPSMGNVSQWVAGTEKGVSNPPQDWEGASTFSGQSPFLLSGNTQNGITVVINRPTEITNADEARATLDQYCSTADLVAKNCDMSTVTSKTPNNTGFLQFGADIDNCSAAATNAVDKTVLITQSYNTASSFSSAAEEKVAVEIPLVAKVETTATQTWGNSWAKTVGFTDSETMHVPPQKKGGFWVQHGYFDVTGDFMITKSDQNYQKFVIKNFSYTLPAKASWPTTDDPAYKGIQVTPMTVQSRVWDCNAAGPVNGAPPVSSTVQNRFVESPRTGPASPETGVGP